ncbi:MAG: hypothetical protein NVS3B19_18950 [Ginsengibacter sp.]
MQIFRKNLNLIVTLFLLLLLVNTEGQTITSFSPTSAGTGNLITINGTGFTGTTAVTFGGISASSFRVLSDNVIHAIVGHGQSGDVKVVVGTLSATHTGFIYDATLPVSFVYFKSGLSENHVLLQWQIEDAADCTSFIVQKSENGTDFIDIAVIKNDLKTVYNYYDNASLKGNLFYRIKTESISGVKSIYSSIIKVIKNFTIPVLSIYPNPVTGRAFNISLSGFGEKSNALQVISTKGNIVLEKEILVTSGVCNATILLPFGSSEGIYTARLMSNNKLVKSIQFIVLNK